MPIYLIRNDDEMPKFAKIEDGKKITWATQAAASGYATPEQALEAFEAACSTMLTAGRAKLKAAQDAQRIVAATYGGFRLLAKDETIDKQKQKGYSHALGATHPLELFCLHWLVRKSKKQEKFHVASRASADDLLSVFETFYVRIAHYDGTPGWLGRPQTKSQTGLVWEPSFSLAVPFSSREAASAELKRRGTSGHIVKTSCVFTEVAAIGQPRADDVSAAISSACEARDIEEVINEGARARLEAMRSQQGPAPEAGEEPKPQRSRL
jgi:hypothetical protein